MKLYTYLFLFITSIVTANALEPGKYLMSCMEVGNKESYPCNGGVITVDENGGVTAKIATESIEEGEQAEVVSTQLIYGATKDRFIIIVNYDVILPEQNPQDKKQKRKHVLTMSFIGNSGNGSVVSLSKHGAHSLTIMAVIGKLPK